MPALLAVILAPAVAAAIDSLLRALLIVRSGGRASRPPRDARPPSERAERWLVVIPARAEGERLQATIDSVLAASPEHNVTTLLLLDGDDGRTAWRGIDVVIKEPAGPSKAAALAWLAREHRARIESCDAILILDAGSRLAPDFFDRFHWPAGADAVQAHLRGAAGFSPPSSSGGLKPGAPGDVGAAAAVSETFAQSREDRGRESLGWNVRLRGTGSAFRPATFLAIQPRLVTRIEDSEASLLITADGGTIRMAPRDAIVLDDKPATVGDAAAQRARWLLGRYELLFRHFGAFAAVVARRPAEGIALIAETFGRPLSLSIPLRLGASALAFWYGQKALGAFLAGSTAIDIAGHSFASGGIPRGSLRFAASWLMALLLLPRAVLRWLRVER